MSDLLDGYAASQRFRGMSPATVDATGRALVRLTNHIGDLTLATRRDIETYLGALDIDPATRAGYLSWYRGFYAWAQSEGYVLENPCAGIPRPRSADRLPRPVTEDDLEIILESPMTPKLRCWVVLAAYAGLRCKEIAGMAVADLDFAHRVLTVSAPKGRRERAVPMHDLVVESLHALPVPGQGYVFPHTDHPLRPCKPHNVSHDVSAWLKACGVNGTAHMLRHRFGTALYRVTKDLRLVQEMMGHRSPMTTAGYTAVDPAQGAQGISGL